MAGLFNFDKPRTAGQWLIFLAATGIILSSPLGTRAFLREVREHINKKKKGIPLRPGDVSRSLYYLKKRKLIDFQEHGGKVSIVLAERSKKRKLYYDVDCMKISRPSSWDGRWRLLMFDVPESRKSIRDALRSKLMDLGFFQFQKSVWIYPFPCENEIDFISEVFSAAPYITLLTVKMENDKPLRRHFKLY